MPPQEVLSHSTRAGEGQGEGGETVDEDWVSLHRDESVGGLVSKDGCLSL